MPEGSPTSYTDAAVFGLCELIGLQLGLPAGEALYRGDHVTVRMVVFLLVAACFAVLGPTWPIMRRRLPANRLVLGLGRLATNASAWFAVLLIALLPDAYQRATDTRPPTPIDLGAEIVFAAAFVGLAIDLLVTSRRSQPARGAVSPTDLQIAITSPVEGGTLEEGKRVLKWGTSYLVRGKLTGSLPNGYAVWVLNEDPFTKRVWPQDYSAIRLKPDGEWEGRTHVSKGQENVTVVAVAAPPAAHELFLYYHEVLRQTTKVVALNRLPDGCVAVDRKQVVAKREEVSA